MADLYFWIPFYHISRGRRTVQKQSRSMKRTERKISQHHSDSGQLAAEWVYDHVILSSIDLFWQIWWHMLRNEMTIVLSIFLDHARVVVVQSLGTILNDSCVIVAAGPGHISKQCTS